MKSKNSGILFVQMKDVLRLELSKLKIPGDEIASIWRSIEGKLVDLILEGYGIRLSSKIGNIYFVPWTNGTLKPVYEPPVPLRSKATSIWRIKNEGYRKVRGTVSFGELQAWFNEKYGEFSVVEDRRGDDDPVQEERCEEDNEESYC